MPRLIALEQPKFCNLGRPPKPPTIELVVVVQENQKRDRSIR
jgi:hypothetical protein